MATVSTIDEEAGTASIEVLTGGVVVARTDYDDATETISRPAKATTTQADFSAFVHNIEDIRFWASRLLLVFAPTKEPPPSAMLSIERSAGGDDIRVLSTASGVVVLDATYHRQGGNETVSVAARPANTLTFGEFLYGVVHAALALIYEVVEINGHKIIGRL